VISAAKARRRSSATKSRRQKPANWSGRRSALRRFRNDKDVPIACDLNELTFDWRHRCRAAPGVICGAGTMTLFPV
jgi:hypothetical protein